MKSCPHCHQPLPEWNIFQHRFTHNLVWARYTCTQIVLKSGLSVSRDLFLEWFDLVGAA